MQRIHEDIEAKILRRTGGKLIERRIETKEVSAKIYNN
jgi:hypothetical protein